MDEILPEWEAFADAAARSRPEAGTWCEAWTVRDIVAHQAGNATELARVLAAHMDGAPVDTRGFEEREAPFRAMADDELWSAAERQVERLAEVAHAAAADLAADTPVGWTGRTMAASWFAEHMREELVLHRWDIAGDDTTATESLAASWMTDHTVIAVGRPLLAKGAAGLDLGPDRRVQGRLRSPGSDDVVVTATPAGNTIERATPTGPATIESDPAARVLFLWGRRPSQPSRWASGAGPESLRAVRTLLSGY